MTLDVAFHSLDGHLKSNHIVIENNAKGFKILLSWVKERKINIKEVLICMEHTGIYADQVVDFLEKKEIAYTLETPFHVKKSFGLVRGKSEKTEK